MFTTTETLFCIMLLLCAQCHIFPTLRLTDAAEIRPTIVDIADDFLSHIQMTGAEEQAVQLASRKLCPKADGKIVRFYYSCIVIDQ